MVRENSFIFSPLKTVVKKYIFLFDLEILVHHTWVQKILCLKFFLNFICLKGLNFCKGLFEEAKWTKKLSNRKKRN